MPTEWLIFCQWFIKGCILKYIPFLLLPYRCHGLLTLWSALSVRRSTIKCFSFCCRSNGPNTVWTHCGSVVRLAATKWILGSREFYLQFTNTTVVFYLKKNICSLLTDFTDVTKRLEEAQAEEMKVKEPVHQQIHRMCLLRVKLMHFVNSLHNYITTRVRRIMNFSWVINDMNNSVINPRS